MESWATLHREVEDKKAFQWNANRPFAKRGPQVNKFEQVWGLGPGESPCGRGKGRGWLHVTYHMGTPLPLTSRHDLKYYLPVNHVRAVHNTNAQFGLF